MARSTFSGRRFIEHNRPSRHYSCQFVASCAARLAMRTLQGKRCPGIVVEERGRPPGAIVTSSARRHSGLGELLTMNIRVTALTLRRRCLEIHAGDGEVG